MAQTIVIDETDNDNDNNDDNGIVDLVNKNSDCIGWIRIDGTKIDYPIMQTRIIRSIICAEILTNSIHIWEHPLWIQGVI